MRTRPTRRAATTHRVYLATPAPRPAPPVTGMNRIGPTRENGMNASSAFDYSITRTVDAPVDKVWRAWTDAEDYGTWASAEDVTLDVRPGGAWSAVMVIPGGGKFTMSGTYVEVVQDNRIVMSMDGPGGAPTLMNLDLAADSGGTRVTVSQTFDNSEER
ncbi:MAG: hypothetical protein GEV11_29010, partial [Streptosporangiales bacterium]|nr:hypothetical protein [Streptosporangiales bacterium]